VTSTTKLHSERVEMIQRKRLTEKLRQAALARVMRRKRKEENVVDRMFCSAQSEGRKSLIRRRARARRVARDAEKQKIAQLENVERQYAERKRMIAEKARREKQDSDIARYAKKMETERKTRELRDEERARAAQLVERLERLDRDEDEAGGFGAAGELHLQLPSARRALSKLLKSVAVGNGGAAGDECGLEYVGGLSSLRRNGPSCAYESPYSAAVSGGGRPLKPGTRRARRVVWRYKKSSIKAAYGV